MVILDAARFEVASGIRRAYIPLAGAGFVPRAFDERQQAEHQSDLTYYPKCQCQPVFYPEIATEDQFDLDFKIEIIIHPKYYSGH